LDIHAATFVAVLPLIVPPFIVNALSLNNKPQYTLMPPPSRAAMLSQMTPPLMVIKPYCTLTPPPSPSLSPLATLPLIVPLFIVNSTAPSVVAM
jgi:hypothetical protein